LWFNVLAISILGVEHLVGQNVIPKDIAGVIIGLGNVLLRLVTTQGVKL
jgi:hypothetical protein